MRRFKTFWARRFIFFWKSHFGKRVRANGFKKSFLKTAYNQFEICGTLRKKLLQKSKYKFFRRDSLVKCSNVSILSIKKAFTLIKRKEKIIFSEFFSNCKNFSTFQTGSALGRLTSQWIFISQETSEPALGRLILILLRFQQGKKIKKWSSVGFE